MSSSVTAWVVENLVRFRVAHEGSVLELVVDDARRHGAGVWRELYQAARAGAAHHCAFQTAAGWVDIFTVPGRAAITFSSTEVGVQTSITVPVAESIFALEFVAMIFA